jgi:hypothetical protein
MKQHRPGDSQPEKQAEDGRHGGIAALTGSGASGFRLCDPCTLHLQVNRWSSSRRAVLVTWSR